jgi:hypothetical protein
MGVVSDQRRALDVAFEPFTGIGRDRDADQGERGEHRGEHAEAAARRGPERHQDEQDRGERDEYHDEMHQQCVRG